jgi:hypothetical protein
MMANLLNVPWSGCVLEDILLDSEDFEELKRELWVAEVDESRT